MKRLISELLNSSQPVGGTHSLTFAFTLAEVLITLGIIGVVAALTISSLIAKYEKKKTVEQLKVAYSILSQAVEKSISENGDIDSWNFGLSAEEFNNTYIIPYLKVVKECNDAKCIKTDNFNGYYDLNDKKYTNMQYSYILSNGMIVMYEKEIVREDNFINFMVDINGQKGKNRMGRDIFCFYLLHHQFKFAAYSNNARGFKDGLYLGSIDNNGYPHFFEDRDLLLGKKGVIPHRGCNKNGTFGGHGGLGAACSAVIAKDGWRISDDYPWK